MKKLLSSILILGTLFSLGGCQTSQTSSINQISTENQEKAEATEERIIAGSVAITEILHALGVNLVGVPTSQYPLPEELKDVTRIGEPMTPDLEIMKSLNPTKIVTVSSLSETLKDVFEQQNMEAEFLSLDNLDMLKENIERLGNDLGKEKEAQDILSAMKEKENKALEIAKGKEAPTVMIIFGAPGNFMIATENSFVGSLAKTLGAENVVNSVGAPFIPVNMEMLAQSQPDFILRMSHANPEQTKLMFDKEFEDNKGWQNFTAVTEGRVFDLENGYFGMTANLKSADALLKLAELIYK